MTKTVLLGLLLTVQSNIMKGQDGRLISLYCPGHDTMDIPILSLYMLLLKQSINASKKSPNLELVFCISYPQIKTC